MSNFNSGSLSGLTIGMKKRKLLRTDLGTYVKGRYVEGQRRVVEFLGNIQPAFSAQQTKLLPEGDREKEMIWGSSKQWIYTARSGGEGGETLPPDYIAHEGCLWEVKWTMPYQNLGFHVEFLAVKVDKDIRPRKEGDVDAS